MNDLFLQGVAEFNRGYFFEAHDVWEELWAMTSGEDRVFYQGLIQTAVGLYHLSSGNATGAVSQLGKAMEKLDRYPPRYHGIKVHQLRDQARKCHEEAEAMRDRRKETFDEQHFPVIEFE